LKPDELAAVLSSLLETYCLPVASKRKHPDSRTLYQADAEGPSQRQELMT
jgi:hypothetical protein